MSRRRHRGERRPALFGFDAGTPTDAPEEVADNPLRHPCTTCGSGIGERCTRPGRGGRKQMHHHFHDARTNRQSTEETTDA
jgi:hypothetical protein